MFIRKFMMALALAPVLLVPLHSRADVLYTINFLPENFYPSDINNTGQMAGSLNLGDGIDHAAIYTDGAVTDLGFFGGTDSNAIAINDGGTVAGHVVTAAGDYRAFTYNNGNMVEIANLYAYGLNSSGDVVGRSTTGSAALYSQGTLTELGYFGTGDYSVARAINDDGHIVGMSTIDLELHSRQHPFVYRDGKLHDLGTLDGREFNSAVAINNAGQIAGYSEGTGGGMHAFLYENGVMTDLGSFGGLNLDVGGMNGHGEIVGQGESWDGPDVTFISRNGVLVDLNTLVDPGTGWTINGAMDINDAGQIIANSCRDDICRPVRLDLASPVPEPHGAFLLLPGLLAVAGVRQRRHAMF
jgi:probable HAF family extracellular repeat protein